MIRIEPKYTEVLLNLMENEQIMPLINRALSTYPMYVSASDHTYIPNIIPTRAELNQAILNYYKYREIGFETIGRFLDELEISMKEIMPYYNQLMFTQDQDYNIIYNVDYVRDTTRNLESDSEGSGTSNTESTDSSTASSEGDVYSKNVHSETPQNSLGIGNTDINDVSYADDATWNHDTTENSTSTSGTAESTGSSTSSLTKVDEETVKEVTKGNYGQVSAQGLVMAYRETILNIVQEIINDKRISELFMTVY